TKKVTALSEEASTAKARKVANIVVDDDALGKAKLSLSGADEKLFRIDDGKLFLRKGAALDFETNPVLDVTVRVNDPATKGIDDTASLAIDLGDEVERYTGTWGSDSVKGHDGAEKFLGRGSGDTIRGRDGDDIIAGQGGDDRLAGNKGDD